MGYCRCCNVEILGKQKICSNCKKSKKREYARSRYDYIMKTVGPDFRKKTVKCSVCGIEYLGYIKKNDSHKYYCESCYKSYKEIKNKTKVTNTYVYITYEGKHTIFEHNRIARSILERNLYSNEIVHHLDGNTENNNSNNLIVLDRRLHGKLHHFLIDIHLILSFNLNITDENWQTIMPAITLSWLEKGFYKFIKLSDFKRI